MNLHATLVFITDIGDSASLVAIAAAGSIYLLIRKSGRAAFFLFGAYLFSAGAIGLLKIIFFGCQHYFDMPDLRSPSGHAALTATVFWSYSILMRRQLDASRRWLPLLLSTLLIAVIAYTRVWLHAHSPLEVWVGLATGIISLFIMNFLVLRGKSTAPYDAYVLALWGLIAAALTHGWHMPAESLIHMLAFHIRGHVSLCT